MRILAALACGVRGAEHGTAEILTRNGGTTATWYSDFDGKTPNSSGAAVSLDANAGAECYVNQHVLVRVRDAAGVIIREFVDAEAAPGVEVVSRSFIGQDYTTGAVGASRPTTLQAVLDKVIDSFGTTDWKVSIGGVNRNLTALGAIYDGYFVVTDPAFGATGDGTTNDLVAIQSAIDAAAAAGGGVVLFPAPSGDAYRVTGTILVPSFVRLLGAPAFGATIEIDHATLPALDFQGAACAAENLIVRPKVGASYTGSLVIQSDASSSLTFEHCVLGSDDVSHRVFEQTAAAVTRFLDTSFLIGDGLTGTSRIVAGDPASGNVFISGGQVNLAVQTIALGTARGLVEGRRVNVHEVAFDLSGLTAGASDTYVVYATTNGHLCATGNVFVSPAATGTGTIFALAGNSAEHLNASGNAFGDNLTPYRVSLLTAADAQRPIALEPPGRQKSYVMGAGDNEVEIDTDRFSRFYVELPSALAASSVSVLLGDPRYPGQRAHVVVRNEKAASVSVAIETTLSNVISSTVNVVIGDNLAEDEHMAVEFQVMWDTFSAQLAWVATGHAVAGYTL